MKEIPENLRMSDQLAKSDSSESHHHPLLLRVVDEEWEEVFEKPSVSPWCVCLLTGMKIGRNAVEIHSTILIHCPLIVWTCGSY